MANKELLKKIVVTNDDGVSSPLLLPLVESLVAAKISTAILPVVPATEQSWISNAISRFRELRANAFKLGDLDGFTIDGTPSDCATIAIHNLCHEKPDLLISGINMGTNASLPYFLCSGTVGAVTQAFLNGVPGIALSCALPPEVFSLWLQKDAVGLKSRFAERLTEVAKQAVRLSLSLIKAKALNVADFYTINLPWDVNSQSEIAFTRLAPATFRNMFSETLPGRFRHHLAGFDFPEALTQSEIPSDLRVLERGAISITPIRFNPSSSLSPQIIEAVMQRQLKGTETGE